jgi:DNA-binding XRE family transcriptional regulator
MLNNIEAERGRMRLTKEALAKRLGITSKTYNGYINGTQVPSGVLISMADLFNCSVDYLLGLTEARN